jgi:N-acetyl-gamma-glutamyl-phosphate reductase
MTRLRVGIIGAGGYTGSELVRFVDAHPHLELAYVAARENAGKTLAEVLPNTEGVRGLGELRLESLEVEDVPRVAGQLDVAFTALPHAASARLGGALHDAGVQVVDLSADFRLRNLGTYQAWYGEHPRPDCLPQAVYGCPELHRAELAGARLIAGPGCYPTSAILPLAPLLRAGLVSADQPLIIDGKSGVSGAGRKPGAAYHLPEAAEGMRPYKVAGSHRHTPEIEQELSLAAGREVKVTFTPQLAPMIRGILTTAYARAVPGVTAEQCRAAARELYAEGLVSVLPEGRLPDTLWVRGSARAHVAYAVDERTGWVIAMGAIDNLARGASAQAVQALNVARGWPDDTGLPRIAQFP